jgi:hypothetical protein
VSLERQGGNIQVTDSNGWAVIRGSRLALDNEFLTVSDPSLKRLHMSKVLKTQMSWKPWENRTQLEVILPIIEGGPVLADDDGKLGSQLDLPIISAEENNLKAQAESSAQTSETAGVAERPLAGSAGWREETLEPPENITPMIDAAVSLDALQTEAAQVASIVAFDDFLCTVAGFSASTCAVSTPFSGLVQKWGFNPLALSRSTATPWLPNSNHQDAERKNVQIAKKERAAVEPQQVNPKALSSVQETSHTSGVIQRSQAKIIVSNEGRRIAGARVFMSRLKDNRVLDLGQTSSDGVLDVRIPKGFWGENLIVFHSCCSPKSLAVKRIVSSGGEVLSAELSSGTGYGVLVQREAYGFLRKVDSSELFSSFGKLTVSGVDGFALYNGTKTPGHLLTKVQIRGARPSEFRVASAEAALSKEEPLKFLVSPSETYSPALALVEQVGGQVFQGVLKNANLRRWRREFIARLMHLQSVRSIVSAESESRMAAAGESLPDIVTRGWSQTQLAGEWDFLLSMIYDENTGSLRLSGMDAQGVEFFEMRHQFSQQTSKEVPETLARMAFNRFVESIPFEASLVEQREQTVQLSFSDLTSYGLKKGTPIALYQQSGEPADSQRLNELAALAVVETSSADKKVSARITHWNRQHRRTEVLPTVVRAVKISPEFYRMESSRKNFALPATAQKARGRGGSY